jgi:hypothetical protein
VKAVVLGTLGTTLAAGACTGAALMTSTRDASSDSAADDEVDGAVVGDDGGGVGFDASGIGDGASWFRQFPDAQAFDGYLPPVVGEYPLSSGQPCGQSPCASGFCEFTSGWCCSGDGRPNGVGCLCGTSLGCLPPQVCCDLPETYVPQCVADLDACAGGRFAWIP